MNDSLEIGLGRIDLPMLFTPIRFPPFAKVVNSAYRVPTQGKTLLWLYAKIQIFTETQAMLLKCSKDNQHVSPHGIRDSLALLRQHRLTGYRILIFNPMLNHLLRLTSHTTLDCFRSNLHNAVIKFPVCNVI